MAQEANLDVLPLIADRIAFHEGSKNTEIELNYTRVHTGANNTRVHTGANNANLFYNFAYHKNVRKCSWLNAYVKLAILR